MAARIVPLNAETSQPQERAEHDLPPKSYADVVANTKSDTSERNDANDESTSEANRNLENYVGSSTAGNVNGFPPTNNEIPKLAHPLDTGADTVYKKNADEEKVVYEKHVDDVGNHLTSVKLPQDYDKQLEHDRETAPREKKNTKTTEVAKKQNGKSHLASGRRAGAGWERSA